MSVWPIAGPADCYVLTPAQQKAVALLAAGSTITAAAHAAGVHRNTVAAWRRHPAIRTAITQAAQPDPAEALALLKAAVAILERQLHPAPGETVHPPHNPAQPRPQVTKNNETNPTEPGKTVHPVHNSAQPAPKNETNPSPITRLPKVGRNQPCPCGSGKKFKRCCLASSHPGF